METLPYVQGHGDEEWRVQPHPVSRLSLFCLIDMLLIARQMQMWL
jgi:hypothetical protein